MKNPSETYSYILDSRKPYAYILDSLNEALGQVCADWGLLDRFQGDDRDAALDDAVHAAFKVLMQGTKGAGQ